MCILGLTFLLSEAIRCNNPFSTREPEPPQKIQSNWIQPTSPNYVIANLRSSISEKNITNYLGCLADTSNSEKTFQFFPEPSVEKTNPGLFTKWDKEDEANYLNQLLLFLPKDSLSYVSFMQLNETTFQDSVILLQKYMLKVNHKCEEQECVREMEGQVEFRLIRTTDDFWFIYRWRDSAIGDAATWSALKANFGK